MRLPHSCPSRGACPGQGVDGAELPLVYSPAAIDGFWGRRPVAVASRALQLLRLGGAFFARLAWDFFTGRLAETEVQRAVALRDIVTSLGPAFIKLGQARRPPRVSRRPRMRWLWQPLPVLHGAQRWRTARAPA
jgi:hypothetical protein